jgi:hypothetical protein
MREDRPIPEALRNKTTRPDYETRVGTDPLLGPPAGYLRDTPEGPVLTPLERVRPAALANKTTVPEKEPGVPLPEHPADHPSRRPLHDRLRMKNDGSPE